jgi:hypothetical protein
MVIVTCTLGLCTAVKAVEFLFVVNYLVAMGVQERVAESTRRKGARREKPHRPEPEEQEGMPQHWHCPHAKRREDRNPKYNYQLSIIISLDEPKTCAAGIHWPRR